jgi:hypothetical protein
MAGLDPAIHENTVISSSNRLKTKGDPDRGTMAEPDGVDGRDEPGHDDEGPRRSRKKAGQQLSL